MNPEILTRLVWALVIVAGGLGLYLLTNRLILARVRGLSSAQGLTHGDRPAILYFTTPDCAPCKTIQRPAIETLQRQLGESFEVVEVDASTRPELASQWGVLSVPTTFILDREGAPRYVNHGVAPVRKLQSQLEGLL
jgi:thiol-disulfide isomerase/thioredoxin